jgi:hypothetical protein
VRSSRSTKRLAVDPVSVDSGNCEERHSRLARTPRPPAYTCVWRTDCTRVSEAVTATNGDADGFDTEISTAVAALALPHHYGNVELALFRLGISVHYAPPCAPGSV